MVKGRESGREVVFVGAERGEKENNREETNRQSAGWSVSRDGDADGHESENDASSVSASRSGGVGGEKGAAVVGGARVGEDGERKGSVSSEGRLGGRASPPLVRGDGSGEGGHRGGGGDKAAPKERTSNEEVIGAILKHLLLPGTPRWRKTNVTRVVVHKGRPENVHWGQFDTPGHLLPDKDVTSFWNFKNCAVVGNSGTLLLDRYGEAIDRHNAVIRFNNGPTQG
ncbi:hypothetical protein CBR_g5723 [Chara braunii]|uniref:beta-galactoside alpha-(2,6)-sialyltransferase n=1 Tax=Chara braunii TaxID=69332 RepID=A0A388KJ59_CHABU|nr:hypothetical protein CBR_g5723 [Chara braunii]|eukprot:GBG70091.1 hypothetical protein CBR_g5723 [Chara braunii]